MTDLVATLLFGLALGVAVLFGEGLRAWAGWAPEASRRFVHAATGLLVAACPGWFSAPWGIYALALLFVVVNLWAVPRRVLPGMHGIARQSWGTVTFPLALVFALVMCWTLSAERIYILQTAFVVLALADPLASLVGMSLQRPGRFTIAGQHKSVAGSAVFFVAAWGLTLLSLVLFERVETMSTETMTVAFVVAALATSTELLAGRGWDNFFIVVAVVAVLTWLHEHPGDAERLALLFGIATAFSVLAHAVRFLDFSGAVAVLALAFSVLVLGPAWAVPGVTFFVLSSLLSRLGRRRKAQAEELAEKGSRRDAGQVYANGGVAWGVLLAYVFIPHEAFYWAYAGAFAAAAADTWGTEVGTLVGGPTRSVWNGRRVAPGSSGGVSVAGTLGALAGAATVFLSLIPFAGDFLDPVSLPIAAGLVVGGGFAAALVDSLVGATLQAVWRDPATGRMTERPQAGPLVRGWRWVTNDRVNLVCTLTGALVPFTVLALR